MNRSFFHYLMTLRGGGTHDALSVFATEAGKDIQFPKHSSSYEEISNYLELNVDYLPSMDIFDEAWDIRDSFVLYDQKSFLSNSLIERIIFISAI